jgi:hypothetical protein
MKRTYQSGAAVDVSAVSLDLDGLPAVSVADWTGTELSSTDRVEIYVGPISAAEDFFRLHELGQIDEVELTDGRTLLAGRREGVDAQGLRWATYAWRIDADELAAYGIGPADTNLEQSANFASSLILASNGKLEVSGGHQADLRQETMLILVPGVGLLDIRREVAERPLSDANAVSGTLGQLRNSPSLVLLSSHHTVYGIPSDHDRRHAIGQLLGELVVEQVP